MSCDAICRVSINHIWVSFRFHHSIKQRQQITLPQHEGVMAASFNWTKEVGYRRIFVYTFCLINICLSLSDDANKIKTLNIERE